MAQLLRDQFIFYIFPIFNPDGVARGHFRVDTNGINLNRCYINPSAKDHSSIYAVKKVIMHTHS
jgi:murein tripeptide amidase MpaA